MVADFRKRFFISLAVTIPALVLSPLIQSFLDLKQNLGFAGHRYLLLALSSFIFFYGCWPFLKGLVDEFEEALPLPPGFVAFGQNESASHLDVARTAVRRAERLAVKMKSEGFVENPQLLRYLNRLSDLVFLLASFEESGSTKRQAVRRQLALSGWREPCYRRWFVIAGVFLLISAGVIILFVVVPRTT